VVAAPEQIVIVNGAAEGIDLLARLLARRGARHGVSAAAELILIWGTISPNPDRVPTMIILPFIYGGFGMAVGALMVWLSVLTGRSLHRLSTRGTGDIQGHALEEGLR
jgi:hypothetical protein